MLLLALEVNEFHAEAAEETQPPSAPFTRRRSGLPRTIAPVRYGTKKILLAYDRDEAGDKAAESLSRELLEMGIACHRVLFPKNMDANEYALKVQPAAKALSVLLNKSEWLGKGPVFRQIATAVGLTGRMTSTVAGPELAERLNAILSQMPGYPHRTLDVHIGAKKQGARLLKIVCPACGYTARTTRQWIERGLPTCPCGAAMREEVSSEIWRKST